MRGAQLPSPYNMICYQSRCNPLDSNRSVKLSGSASISSKPTNALNAVITTTTKPSGFQVVITRQSIPLPDKIVLCNEGSFSDEDSYDLREGCSFLKPSSRKDLDAHWEQCLDVIPECDIDDERPFATTVESSLDCDAGVFLEDEDGFNATVSYDYADILNELSHCSASDVDYTEWDGDDDATYVLSVMLKQTCDIFIESINPRKTPHILITLALDGWTHQTTAFENGVQMQDMNSLSVPPFNACYTTMPPLPSDNFYPNHTPQIQASEETTLSTAIPVFSAAQFCRFIERSSQERLSTYPVIPVLYHHALKAAVFAASSVAIIFRTRYDATSCMIDKPFRWTDPAVPILQRARYLCGTEVIDSLQPFSVPHIVISLAPPENPWIPWGNRLYTPQDHGYGCYLVVPGTKWIRDVDDDNQSTAQQVASEEGPIDDVHCHFGDWDTSFCEDPDDSPSETPGPRTPAAEESEKLPDCFAWSRGACDEDDCGTSWADLDEGLPSLDDDPFYHSTAF